MAFSDEVLVAFFAVEPSLVLMLHSSHVGFEIPSFLKMHAASIIRAEQNFLFLLRPLYKFAILY